MAKEEKNKTLSELIGRTVLRVSRNIGNKKGDDLTEIVGVIAMLNQAQMLVGISDKMARRILNKALAKIS